MPIFNYKCKDCDSEFEYFKANIQTKEELQCKKCKSKNLEKLVAAHTYIDPILCYETTTGKRTV